MTPARHRRIVTLVALATWLFALACTSVHACELGIPAQHEDCCPTQAIDATCTTHCELDQQAPGGVWPDLAQVAFAAPAFRITVPAPAFRAPPSLEAHGTSPPLTILFLRLRN
jgi:hypothetical protein